MPDSNHMFVSDLTNDPDMAELVALFLGEMPARARAVRDSFTARDWTVLTTAAHRLRGSAGGYGFPAIGEAAASLEDALRRERGREEAALERIAAEVDRLAAMCERAAGGR
jgi:HPt (histidine-containing phosphotransfer) domain-containing protein